MKVRFIYPSINFKKNELIRKHRKAFFPPLNICILAASTPEDVEVALTDENNDVVDFEEKADLVAITSMTCTAPRMYEIADSFRNRGIYVVLGGTHVTALPDEALQHADAIVLGEAEELWPKLIEDFKNKRLQKVYRNSCRPDLKHLPLPRRSLLKPKGYYYKNTVQTSRGCPYNCSFCTVTNFFGGSYRFRPIEDVVKEIDSLDGSNVIGFTDDNIMATPARAKKLFQEITPLKIIWGGQASINLAESDALLEAASMSGCKALFIGFESISTKALSEANKPINKPEKYLKAIEKIHSYGISILGSFVFGFDSDEQDVFKNTVNFAKEAKLELAQFSILTPFPGTAFYNKLEAEGRILHRDWSKYYQGEACFQPANMSPEELKRNQKWAWNNFYKNFSILRRTLRHGIKYFPLFWLANRFFNNINFSNVNPVIKFVQKGWSFLDEKVRS
jgi:radical SAM superfamily enzyme YgiQ (UPF0313 family)